MDRWEGDDYARHIILFIHYKFWFLYQPKVSVPLTYNGRNSGSCDNFKTAGYFLMKLNKWIDDKVEIMHILSLARLDEVQDELLYYPGVGVGVGVGGGVGRR